MYAHITRGIRVEVETDYLDDQSAPEDHRYVWAYTIRIENKGGETVRLTRRYWRITDGFGKVREVRGVGVVGEQPVLKPGERFEYTSGAPLGTPSGIMVGHYQMETESGEAIDVAVPAFSLDSPYDIRRIH